jgi:hypothetical protein
VGPAAASLTGQLASVRTSPSGWRSPKALEVPPLLLLFPLGESDVVESLPGKTEDTWTAVKDFIGENGGVAPGVVDQFRAYEHYIRRLLVSYREVVNLQRDNLAAANERYERMRREDLQPVRDVRKSIRAQGLEPPALPDGLPSHLYLDPEVSQ